jgi:hypothetical protein
MICLKFLRTRKYNLEQKCDWNLSVLLVFIVIVACDLNCIVRMVHACPFWALTVFLVCFLSLAVGQIELTWVQNGTPKLKKEYSILEKQYTRCIMIIFSQGGLQRTGRKLERLFTLFHCELYKKTPSLVLYFTHSVVHELIYPNLSSNLKFLHCY